MEDYKLICKILKVLLACEDKIEWSELLLSPEIIRNIRQECTSTTGKTAKEESGLP